MPELACQNCGTTDPSRRVARLSFDLDLPTVVLCDVCSLLIVSDRDMFDELGGRNRKRRKPSRQPCPDRTETPTDD